ncbi:helix-turn-helix domain-containing protein [Parabacteroides sp. OttesenSCG-928-J18]|nr:helix-turn-helix domain-containing protein [Parabacteroides sp. OttesenSCG-928-J18]
MQCTIEDIQYQHGAENNDCQVQSQDKPRPEAHTSICKEVSGITSKGCIDHHIISHARLLLVSTDKTILQISDELNFPNSSFFSKYFKKHVGMTPKVYRDVHSD